MPIEINSRDQGLSLPQSMIGGEHDTLAQNQYINDLSDLPNISAIPSVVLGIARHVVLESGRRNILFLLPLVTDNFWKAVNDYFEPYIWRVGQPDDVKTDSVHFDTQTRLVTKLIFELSASGAYVTGNTDTTRRKNAQAIIDQISKLREMLDEQTGFSVGDEYTGLWAPNPWEILENTAIQFAHELVPQPTGTPYRKFTGLNSHDHEIVSRLSFQDLLSVTEQRFLAGTENELSKHRQKQGRHVRFASKLAKWFGEVRDEKGEDTPEPNQAIVETTAAILKARYPDQPDMIIKRPLG